MVLVPTVSDVGTLKIAKTSLNICNNGIDPDNFNQYFFHEKCYNGFTDVAKLKKAELQDQVCCKLVICMKC